MTPARRATGFAVVLGLVAVAVLASWFPGDSGRSWLVLPYWLDVAREQILVLAVLGGPAALVAGRAPYRVALAGLFLSIGMAVQVIAAMSLSLRPGCVSAFSDLPLTVFMVFISPLVVSQAWGGAGGPLIAGIVSVAAVFVAAVFAYAVLPRRPLLVRMGAVTALLLVVAAGTAVVGNLRAASLRVISCVPPEPADRDPLMYRFVSIDYGNDGRGRRRIYVRIRLKNTQGDVMTFTHYGKAVLMPTARNDKDALAVLGPLRGEMVRMSGVGGEVVSTLKPMHEDLSISVRGPYATEQQWHDFLGGRTNLYLFDFLSVKHAGERRYTPMECAILRAAKDGFDFRECPEMGFGA